MIVVAGTVKDTLENVRSYVRRNLAAGADHVVVFLDAADPTVQGWLDQHPHATPIVCDDRWWVPERPERLNARQVTNANLAQTALACVPGEHWFFHLDADEVLQLDRERLERLDAEVVKLAPIEAISTYDGRELPHFKRRLNRAEVDRLVAAGLLEPPPPDEPVNSTWFRGHLMGKVGVRPNPDVWMQLHRVVYCGPDEQEVAATKADWLAHRHYESVSGREFVRKWLSHLAAGEIRLRPARRRLAAALQATQDLPEAEREEAMIAIYRDQVEDRYDELLATGVLVELPSPTYEPRDFDVAQFERVLGVLAGADKRAFNPRIPDVWPRPVLEAIGDPLLQPAIERARASERTRGATPPGLEGPRSLGRFQRLVRRRRL